MASTKLTLATWNKSALPLTGTSKTLTLKADQPIPEDKGTASVVVAGTNADQLSGYLRVGPKKQKVALDFKPSDTGAVATIPQNVDLAGPWAIVVKDGKKDDVHPTVSSVSVQVEQTEEPPPVVDVSQHLYAPTGGLSSIPEARRKDIALGLLKWTNSDKAMLDTHVAWHMNTDMSAPDYGGKFVFFHAGMVEDAGRRTGMTPAELSNFAVELGKPLPSGFGADKNEFAAMLKDAALAPNTVTRTRYSMENGPTLPAQFSDANLAQFKTPDELGEALEQGFHGSGHNWIGGTMSTFQSPRDPVFFAWHGLVNQTLMKWFQTDNGKAWLAVPENAKRFESALDEHAGHQHAMAMGFAATSQPSSPPSELAQTLTRWQKLERMASSANASTEVKTLAQAIKTNVELLMSEAPLDQRRAASKALTSVFKDALFRLTNQ